MQISIAFKLNCTPQPMLRRQITKDRRIIHKANMKHSSAHLTFQYNHCLENQKYICANCRKFGTSKAFFQDFHFIVSSESLKNIHQPLFSCESIVILDVCLRRSLALSGRFFTLTELHFTDLPVVLLFHRADSTFPLPLECGNGKL